MIEEKIKDYFQRFSDLRILFFFDEEQKYLEEVKDWICLISILNIGKTRHLA